MKQKRILVINPKPLFPVIMMNQNRVVNMVRRLSADHIVDVASLSMNTADAELSTNELKQICNRYYPLPFLHSSKNFILQKLRRLPVHLNRLVIGYPFDYSYWKNKKLVTSLVRLIQENKYDIVLSNYWYTGYFFRYLDDSIFKAIDTHGIISEKQKLLRRSGKKLREKIVTKRENKEYGILEFKLLETADHLIFNSKTDLDSIKNKNIIGKSTVIQNGQDIDYYLQYKEKVDQKTILFYGSMQGKQNILAFQRFWKSILPLIKKQREDVKVVIAGANPPEEISSLDNRKDVLVTGFVKDIRTVIAKATVMILPLEVGSGFRGRVVEVMALGIPVIGTHNALDNIDLTDGIHGYISDNNIDIAKYALQIMNNPEQREKMSNECRNFVAQKYSIEATYGKLSKYYLNLN